MNEIKCDIIDIFKWKKQVQQSLVGLARGFQKNRES